MIKLKSSVPLASHLAISYIDLMEREFPGFNVDVDTVFKAADEMVRITMEKDLSLPENRAILERATRYIKAEMNRRRFRRVK